MRKREGERGKESEGRRARKGEREREIVSEGEKERDNGSFTWVKRREQMRQQSNRQIGVLDTYINIYGRTHSQTHTQPN